MRRAKPETGRSVPSQSMPSQTGGRRQTCRRCGPATRHGVLASGHCDCTVTTSGSEGSQVGTSRHEQSPAKVRMDQLEGLFWPGVQVVQDSWSRTSKLVVRVQFPSPAPSHRAVSVRGPRAVRCRQPVRGDASGTRFHGSCTSQQEELFYHFGADAAPPLGLSSPDYEGRGQYNLTSGTRINQQAGSGVADSFATPRSSVGCATVVSGGRSSRAPRTFRRNQFGKCDNSPGHHGR
jgi:hypothetical protein